MAWEYLEKWGKPCTPNQDKARILLNGKTFSVRFYGKQFGYSGWYEAAIDGAKVLRPYAKFPALIRALERKYPAI